MPELHDELRELSHRLELPPTPDVTPAVLRRIETTQPRRTGFPLLRYAIAGLVVVIAGFAVLVASSPDVRAAIAELLRFAGIVVREVPETAPTGRPTGSPTGQPTATSGPAQQERVTGVAEASRRTGIPVRVPAVLGPPDEVYVIDNRVAALVYPDAGIRVDQFDGTVDFSWIKGVDAPPKWLRVNGGEALWFDQPHELVYVDRDGKEHRESARLAGNTLIWQADDVTFRLEGEIGRDKAVAIARSLKE